MGDRGSAPGGRQARKHGGRLSRLLAVSMGIAVVAAFTGPAAMASPKSQIAPAPGASRVSVIVQALPGRAGVAERLVRLLGGRVTTELPIVGGFAATVPATTVRALRAVPGVVSVTPDSVLHADGDSYTGTPSTYARSPIWGPCTTSPP